MKSEKYVTLGGALAFALASNWKTSIVYPGAGGCIIWEPCLIV